MSDSLQLPRPLCPWDSPGKNTGNCHLLLQGIFPTQGSKSGVPHCRQILYCLSHQGSPIYYTSNVIQSFFLKEIIRLINKYLYAQHLYLCLFLFNDVINCSLNLLSNMSQFSSDAQSYLTLCNPMDCSIPGFPVHHQLLELAQTHVHQVGDAIQPSHPLSSPSPPSIFPSIRQDLF